MSSPIFIATIALQGASAAIAGELSVRCLSPRRNKVLHIRVCKFILGLSMAVKTIMFLTFHASIGTSCNIVGRISDFLYHISMTAGTAVLVSRVQSIIPIQWKRFAFISHISIVIFRLLVGIVDTGVAAIKVFENGSCDYIGANYWGPFYTLYDTLIDIYVTFVISLVIISHIRSFDLGSIRVNMTLYTSVVYNNIIRSILLTIVNVISTAFIITKDNNEYIMLVWPIINIIFVILVGYDSDVTKAIRKIQQRHGNKKSSVDSFNLDDTASASRPQMTEKKTSRRQFDVENQIPMDETSSSTEKEHTLFENQVESTSSNTDNTRI